MTAILEVKELVKHFDTVKAVNGVSFAISPGRCFGLLGPNGAGKTTTVEMMEGISQPTAGDILYKGVPLGRRFRNEAGIQFQSTALQDFLTVYEVLRLLAQLYPRGMDLEELIELCALREFLHRDNRNLSGGQRQRLLIALALVNDPEVVFLDEPTTGLDPQARRNFWDLVQLIKARDKTIVLTTHYMEEAYVLCDGIAIMDHGRIIAQDTPQALLAAHFNDVVLELPIEDFSVADQSFPLAVTTREHRVQICATDVTQVIQALLSAGVSLARLEIRQRTLEDLFIELTGRDLRG